MLIYSFIIFVECTVYLQAWADGDATNVGHIDFINKRVLSVLDDGFSVATVKDLKECQAGNVSHFNIAERHDAHAFVAFIKSLPAGTIVVGASGGLISGQEDIVQETLVEMGLTIHGINNSFSMTFYAMKGDPDYAFQRLVAATKGPNQLHKQLSKPARGKFLTQVTK